MTVVQDNLEAQLSLDFARTCSELAQARMAVSARDDAGNRRAVVICRAQADAVLDMYLALSPGTAP